MKGIAAVLAGVRSPFFHSISMSLPGSASSAGTQTYPLLRCRRGDQTRSVTRPTRCPPARAGRPRLGDLEEGGVSGCLDTHELACDSPFADPLQRGSPAPSTRSPGRRDTPASTCGYTRRTPCSPTAASPRKTATSGTTGRSTRCWRSPLGLPWPHCSPAHHPSTDDAFAPGRAARTPGTGSSRLTN